MFRSDNSKLSQDALGEENQSCCFADLLTKAEVLDLAEKVGPFFICCLKTHIDIMTDFDSDFVVKVKALAHWSQLFNP